MCRAKKVGYISSATLGPWGYAFVDYGDKHMVTEEEGEDDAAAITRLEE